MFFLINSLKKETQPLYDGDEKVYFHNGIAFSFLKTEAWYLAEQ